MKTHIIIYLSAAILILGMLTGCNKEAMLNNGSLNRIAVSIEDNSSTKVSIDGTKVTWNDADQITVAEINNGSFASLTTYTIDAATISSDGRSAEFVGDVMLKNGTTYMAVTGKNITIEDGKLNINSKIDNEQQNSSNAEHFEDEWFMTSNSFAVQAGAMPTIKFVNQQSVLSLDLKMNSEATGNYEVERIEFSSVSSAFSSQWLVSANGSIAAYQNLFSTISQKLSNAHISSNSSYLAKLPIWWNPNENISSEDRFTITIFFSDGTTAQTSIDAKKLESGKLYKTSLEFALEEKTFTKLADYSATSFPMNSDQWLIEDLTGTTAQFEGLLAALNAASAERRIELSAPNIDAFPDNALKGNQTLYGVTAPKAKMVGISSFESSAELYYVYMEEALSLGQRAFAYCPKLRIMNFKKVENISPDFILGSGANNDNSGGIDFTLPDKFGVEDGTIKDETGNTIVSTPNKDGDVHLYGVDTITPYLYIGNSNIKRIYAPDVKTIGENAFEGCTSLIYLELGTNHEETMTVGADILKGVPTQNIDLHLGVGETDNVSGLVWKGYTFKSINFKGGSSEFIQFEDPAFKAALVALTGESLVDTNGDGEISYAEAAAATCVDVSGSWGNPGTIKSMPEIQYFTALTELYCSFNTLTALDVSDNVALTYLSCSNNALTTLDVSKNTVLAELQCYSNSLTTLDVSKNTALTDLDCSGNSLTTLDVSGATALTGLGCTDNSLTKLDVTKNTALTDLICSSNALTTLDVSKNTVLTGLGCYSNSITILDVSNNTALTGLECYDNTLTTLDVSNNTALTFLSCDNNTLTTLDVSMLTELGEENLICGNQKDNGTITVTMTSAQNNLPVLGNSSNDRVVISLVGGGNSDFIQFEDPAFKAALVAARGEYLVDTNGDGEISYAEAAAATHVNVSGSWNNIGSIKSMIELQYFTALTYLSCAYNSLTTLNVSKNTALAELYCNSNSLTVLDVSNNTALTDLNCGWNTLTTLDVSKNTALTDLECSRNSLTTLDVSENTALKILSCLENSLTTLDVSGAIALTELLCPSNSLTTLDVSKNTELTYLICYSNLLTELDVSRNTALTYLSCERNSLTTLNVSGAAALTDLNCGENSLTTLDVSKNAALTHLYCERNSLSTLDVSNNTVLTELRCQENTLTTLDVSGATKLTALVCYSNSLTTLDISKNVVLTHLSCIKNYLTTLDVSMLTELGAERLWCGNQKDNGTITVTMTLAQNDLPVLISSSGNDRVNISIQ